MNKKRHTWETAKKHDLADGIKNLVEVFGPPDEIQVISDDEQMLAKWRKDDGSK